MGRINQKHFDKLVAEGTAEIVSATRLPADHPLLKMPKVILRGEPPVVDGSATLTLPPSTNGLFLSAGRRRVKTPEYRQWITENTWKVAAMVKPAAFPVHVRIKVCGKVNARRDLDNMIKPVLDLLVSAGAIPDDNVKHVTGGRWEYAPSEDAPHVVVWLEEVQ